MKPESIPFRERTRARSHLILDANTRISVDWAPKRVGVVVRGTAACLQKKRGRSPAGAKSKTVNLAIKNRTHFSTQNSGESSQLEPTTDGDEFARPSLGDSPEFSFVRGRSPEARAVNEHFPESIFFDNFRFACVQRVFSFNLQSFVSRAGS